MYHVLVILRLRIPDVVLPSVVWQPMTATTAISNGQHDPHSLGLDKAECRVHTALVGCLEAQAGVRSCALYILLGPPGVLPPFHCCAFLRKP